LKKEDFFFNLNVVASEVKKRKKKQICKVYWLKKIEKKK
jgi:hypothetical protein